MTCEICGTAQEQHDQRWHVMAERVARLEAEKADWHKVGDGAFARPFGTIRQCTECGALVGGGPVRCVRCVHVLEQQAAKPVPPASGQLVGAGEKCGNHDCGPNCTHGIGLLCGHDEGDECTNTSCYYAAQPVEPGRSLSERVRDFDGSRRFSDEVYALERERSAAIEGYRIATHFRIEADEKVADLTKRLAAAERERDEALCDSGTWEARCAADVEAERARCLAWVDWCKNVEGGGSDAAYGILSGTPAPGGERFCAGLCKGSVCNCPEQCGGEAGK